MVERGAGPRLNGVTVKARGRETLVCLLAVLFVTGEAVVLILWNPDGFEIRPRVAGRAVKADVGSYK